MSNGATISLGVGARRLRDRDYLSTSDPYLLVSKPSASGGYTQLRKSETRKNCLNPDWSDFLFNDQELNQHDWDLQLKLEVFDNDFGSSRDDFMGVAYVSLRQLEAAALVKSSLALSDGKGKVRAGSLVVRSFSRHQQTQGAGYPRGHGNGGPANAPSPFTASAQASHPSVASSGPYNPAPYFASAPAHYPASTPQPYPASTPAPYPASTPAPYPASTPAPYPASTPAPYPASNPSPYPSSAPAPYTAQGPEGHYPPAPYPPASGVYPHLPSAPPNLPPAYPQPSTYNRPGPGGFITRPY